eukprot:TRINITY_DN431_c0_g1_i1.p1 TRINITY_DN431_c0_g1~~TRINITY_DN431_c0_g1_i1.p1  ORF type:complete len:517 (-),score=135.73 TRINITY_DN431_c0_g1_i1:83-1609(-)
MALRDVPFMGVIYVVHEASKMGFSSANPEWCNLGIGQPQIGRLEGSPARINSIEFEEKDQAYGPLGGTEPLRSAVANHYNRLFRSSLPSQYTHENISIASGGRLCLSRVFAALGNVNVGYFNPEYTAYGDLFTYHLSRITPICLPTTPENFWQMSAAEFESKVIEHKLSALILSNPCNPTGRILKGEQMKNYIDVARRHNVLLILDEFYSHFIYNVDGTPADGAISAASQVIDVDNDPVILIDGLTKNYRYPGWRVGWIVGPKDAIGKIDRAASAIDGGPSQPIQALTLKVLEPSYADIETENLRKVFARKRVIMFERLTKMGIKCYQDPNGGATFYIWGCVSDLKAKPHFHQPQCPPTTSKSQALIPSKRRHLQPTSKEPMCHMEPHPTPSNHRCSHTPWSKSPLTTRKTLDALLLSPASAFSASPSPGSLESSASAASSALHTSSDTSADGSSPRSCAFSSLSSSSLPSSPSTKDTWSLCNPRDSTGFRDWRTSSHRSIPHLMMRN